MKNRNLTPARLRNLDRLATYLESLPKGYKHFDMGSYFYGELVGYGEKEYGFYNGGLEEIAKLAKGSGRNCGTAACAAGHGPSAGLFVPPSCVSGWGDVSWAEYTKQMFHGEDFEIEDFIFGGSWSFIDGHHWSAAARIRYVIANLGAPVNFSSKSSTRTLYKEFKIKEAVPLPRDFYTEPMLKRFAEGEAKRAKLELVEA